MIKKRMTQAEYSICREKIFAKYNDLPPSKKAMKIIKALNKIEVIR